MIEAGVSVEDQETGILIRQATAWDVVKIGRLSLQAIEEQGEHAWFPLPDPRGLKLVGSILLVIERGMTVVATTKEGRIVGVLAMDIQRYGWSDEYLLTNEWFYVLPAYRTGKYARTAFMLMEAIERFADSRRHPRTGAGLPVQISIHSGVDAELKDGFLRSRGYRYVGGNFRREPRGQQEVQHDDGKQAD